MNHATLLIYGPINLRVGEKRAEVSKPAEPRKLASFRPSEEYLREIGHPNVKNAAAQDAKMAVTTGYSPPRCNGPIEPVAAAPELKAGDLVMCFDHRDKKWGAYTFSHFERGYAVLNRSNSGLEYTHIWHSDGARTWRLPTSANSPNTRRVG